MASSARAPVPALLSQDSCLLSCLARGLTEGRDPPSVLSGRTASPAWTGGVREGTAPLSQPVLGLSLQGPQEGAEGMAQTAGPGRVCVWTCVRLDLLLLSGQVIPWGPPRSECLHIGHPRMTSLCFQREGWSACRHLRAGGGAAISLVASAAAGDQ